MKKSLIKDQLAWDKFFEESSKRETYPPKKIELFNRLMAYTNNFFVVAAIGAISPGYIMIITKILETQLDIIKPSDIFSPDINNVILRLLKEKYEGKCYKSCLILKITQIIRASNIYMSYNLDGSAFISVLFEVKGLIYQKGEIITDAVIVNKDSNGTVQCQTQYASIHLRQDKVLNIFKNNQRIPLIVHKVRYILNQNNISILGKPFKPN